MNGFDRRVMFALAAGGVAQAGLAHAQAPSQEMASGIQHVEVNGTKLAYELHSQGSGRRPLVFGHGYALRGTGVMYSPLISGLAAEFDVYALDMRGHGASAASCAGWSQAAIADDLAAFVEKLDLRGAAYAGHSLGGFTGMFTQIRHPGTFSALALLATAVAAGSPAPPGLMETFVARGKDPAFTQGAFGSMFLHPGPDDVRHAVDAVSLVEPGVHEAFFPNYARNVITERLAEIRVPVLLVNGAKDNVVSPAEQHRTASGLSLSKEVTFSTEGHMLPIEAHEATAREMLTFLKHDVGRIFRS